MRLTSLQLNEFRNFSRQDIRLRPRVNFLVGENGQGKTNLLEAVYLLCAAEVLFAPLTPKAFCAGADREKRKSTDISSAAVWITRWKWCSKPVAMASDREWQTRELRHFEFSFSGDFVQSREPFGDQIGPRSAAPVDRRISDELMIHAKRVCSASFFGR